MVADTFALGITLFATWLSGHNSQKTNSDYHLIEIIAALINGIGLVAIGDKPPLALTLFRYCDGNGLIQLLAWLYQV